MPVFQSVKAPLWVPTSRRQRSAPMTSIVAVTSASLLARIPQARANVTDANPFQTTRRRDKAAVDCWDLSIELWNGSVNPSPASAASEEVSAGNWVGYRCCLFIGGADKSLDQSAATSYPLTWIAAFANTPGYLWKLNGQQPTDQEVADAKTAGTLQLTNANRRIVIPSGWRVRSDDATGSTLAAGQSYVWAIEDNYPTGVSAQRMTASQLRSANGDRTKLGSSSGQYVELKNWSSLSGTGASGAAPVPCAVWAKTAPGKEPVVIIGDSIACEVNDSGAGSTTALGDTDGALTWAGRACNLAGIPQVKTAIPGVKASVTKESVEAGNGGDAQRLLSMRFSRWALSDMGHNDRGRSATDFFAIMRWYWPRQRAAMLGGTGKVLQTDLLPQASSTDSWATTANQTNVVSGSNQYSSFNPFIQAGSFNPAGGDPDKGFSIYNALYSWANGVGTLDVVDRKWPANGSAQPSSLAFDASHPKAEIHAGIGGILAAALPGLVA